MGKIGDIIYSVYTNKKKVDILQQEIRNKEWDSISAFILTNSTFLDVGCGTGYAMVKAKTEKNCAVSGIDPNPGLHGVGRFAVERQLSPNIIQAFAENIPFENNQFDVVYSSHVLEHVHDEKKTLQEINRVMNNDGILILGMPTATMAYINLFSNLIFTSHVKLYELIMGLTKGIFLENFIRIFQIRSHSYPKGISIFYDIKNYRESRWEKLIGSEFNIIEIIRPCLYPYPDYPQFFKPRKLKHFSSSVFFICKKNH
jgi:ubiquinone/menaquinone biosynthesis C-methylase UbiE